MDVQGNAFSLGAWAGAAGESLYGLSITYSDSGGAGYVGFGTTRANANWLWTHPAVDGGTTPVTSMMLDSAHRVLLYDPANPRTAGVILDPVNGSSFHGPLRVNPQGDVSMGDFQSGITPP